MTDPMGVQLAVLVGVAGQRQLWRTMRMLQEAQQALAMDLDPKYAEGFIIPEYPVIKPKKVRRIERQLRNQS